MLRLKLPQFRHDLRWYGFRALRERTHSNRLLAITWAAALALALAACGGGDRQDKNEPEGTWKVDVISASFPGRQHLGQNAEFKITVKNDDSRALPNLTVTVDGFDQRKDESGLANPERPIWVIDEGPDNSTTAATNTWASGSLPSGQARTMTWKVAAVRAGTYTLRWRVGAGLNGKAKARLASDGSIPKGSFIARVTDKPRKPKID